MNKSNLADRDPFFIGWRPVAKSYRRLLLPATAGALIAIFVFAIALGRSQHVDSAGEWKTGQTVSLDGIAYADPCPVLRVAGNPTRTILLVEQGKFGADKRIRAFDGKPVRATGTVLRNGDLMMLELAENEVGLAPIELSDEHQARLRRMTTRVGPEVEIVGEIVDSKCYLGAMRPGRGKVHRGCAALCLRGGIPPLLLPHVAGDGPAAYVVTGLTPEEAAQNAGKALHLTARMEQWDDLAVLRATTAGVRVP